MRMRAPRLYSRFSAGGSSSAPTLTRTPQPSLRLQAPVSSGRTATWSGRCRRATCV